MKPTCTMTKLLVIVGLIGLFMLIRYWSIRVYNTFSDVDISSCITVAKQLNPIIRKNDIPVFYINMDKNTARRQYIEKQLYEHRLYGTRIPGVNGKKLNLYKSDANSEIQYINNCHDISLSELGCTLAHLKAIKYTYDNGYQIAMIIEDDCCFDLLYLRDDTFNDVIQNAPNDWEVMQMYGFKCSHLKDTLYKPHVRGTYCWSNACYIINRKGMESVMKSRYDYKTDKFIIGKYGISEHLRHDGVADALLYDSVKKAYTYTIPMVYANKNFESTIEYGHMFGQDECANRILQIYKLANECLFIPKSVFDTNVPDTNVSVSNIRNLVWNNIVNQSDSDIYTLLYRYGGIWFKQEPCPIQDTKYDYFENSKYIVVKKKYNRYLAILINKGNQRNLSALSQLYPNEYHIDE